MPIDSTAPTGWTISKSCMGMDICGNGTPFCKAAVERWNSPGLIVPRGGDGADAQKATFAFQPEKQYTVDAAIAAAAACAAIGIGAIHPPSEPEKQQLPTYEQ